MNTSQTTMTASTTTTPEQVTPPGVTVPPLPSAELADLVARYEAKWPEIAYAKGGSRARKAMQYVLEGRCQQAGTDDLGNDIWIVNSNRCSKAGKWCECEDRIRTDLTYGKLCAHRLAIALKTHWMGDKNPDLINALVALLQYNARRLDLLVDRTYAHHGDGERTVLVGWIDENRQHQTWPPALRVPFTLPQFQNALQAIGGWGLLELPFNLGGNAGNYRYTIAADGALPPTPEIFYQKQRTGIAIERERSRKMLLADIAANLPDVLAGPLSITLSDWEAKRVMQLRHEMQRQQATAAEVWSRLPEPVRLAILEKASGEHIDLKHSSNTAVLAAWARGELHKPEQEIA